MPEHLHKSKAQAIVEFALAATLIFFLLSAAVDVGLMFFNVQGLHNAAQEGATFGSRWLKTQGGVTELDINAIKDRARHEAGSQGGTGFVNLLDLDSDGQRDVGPTDTTEIGSSGATYDTLPNGNRVIDDFIRVQALLDANNDGNPLNDGAAPGYTPCPNLSDAGSNCYVHVITSSNYNMIFMLAPVFGKQIRLSSSYVMPLRSGFSQSGEMENTPIVRTLTPSPTPTRQPTNTPTLSPTRTNTPTRTPTRTPRP